MRKYAIVDIETTGGAYNRDRIVEIAIIVTDGNQVLEEFESLVYPERSIPHSITRITGIDDEMVRDAPKFYEIAKQIIEITEKCVFVAHNVKFDYSFVKEEFKNLGFVYNRKTLCTVKLNRQLIPGLNSYGLDNLIRHFNITITDRHRAYGDAYATFEIFSALLADTTDNHHIDLIINQGISATVLPRGISIEQIHDAPEKPGVYYLCTAQDRVVYVGKAKDIKKRLFQHFRQLSRKSVNIYNMIANIRYTETGHELIALLLELHEIKTIQPELNKSLRRQNYPYALYQRLHSGPDEAVLLILKNNNKNDLRYKKIKLFGSKQSADTYIQRIICEEQICRKWIRSRARTFKCFCDQSCLFFFGEKNGSIDRIAELGKNEFEQDFVALLPGRNTEEQAFILIKDKRFFGFGYINKEDIILQMEDWINYVDRQFFYPEANGIIKTFLARNKIALISQ